MSAVLRSEPCNDHHIFPRDAFTRMPKAEVWCSRPKDHEGGHEAVRNGVAYVWRAEEVITTPENIDDRIDAWRDTDSRGELYEFLGWTREQYAAWVERGEFPVLQ